MHEEPRASALRKVKSLVFLFPAVLTAGLVLGILPRTQVSLAEIPERLQKAAAAVVETAVLPAAATPRPAVTPAPEPEEGGQAAAGHYADGVYTGSAQGYGGPVTVQVTVENGSITQVTILSAPGETEPYITLAKTVIDQVLRLQTWELDAVTGASYSSRGILGAIQNALTGERVENEAPETVTPAGTTAQESFTEPAAYRDGTYTGSAQGFGGTIQVEVTISGGKITGLRVVSAPYETEPYITNAQRVVSSILAAGTPNVDAVTGATYSSTGIINATKRALRQAAADGADPEETPAAPEIDPGVMPAEPLTDGVYTGTGEGFGGDVTVRVTVEDGRIADITVLGAEGETPAYFNQALVLLPAILREQSAEIDGVTGASLSSGGLLDGVRAALAQAARPAEEPGGEDAPGEDSGTDGPPTDGPGREDEPSPQETPGIDPGEESPAGPYADGVYTAAGWCEDDYGYTFSYELTVTVTVENGWIVRVEAQKGADESDYPEDNEIYLGRAVNGRTRLGTAYPGVPAQIVENQGTDGVDAVASATYSSRMIRQLADEALSGAAGTVRPEDPAETPGEDRPPEPLPAETPEAEQPEIEPPAEPSREEAEASDLPQEAEAALPVPPEEDAAVPPEPQGLPEESPAEPVPEPEPEREPETDGEEAGA